MTAYQRLAAIAYSLILLVNAAMWLAIFFLVDRTQLITILHYNIYFGPDVFGSWYDLMTLPAIGLVIAVLNFILMTVLWRRDRFLAYVATGGAGLTQLVLAVATALMIMINRP